MKLILDFILVTGIVLNAFVVLRLCNKAREHFPFKLLIIVFGLSVVILINFYAHLHGLQILYLLSFVIEDASRFLIAPLIFLYIKSLFYKGNRFRSDHLTHVLPFLIYLFAVSVPLTLTMGSSGYSFRHLYFLVNTQNFTLGKDLFFIAYLFMSIKKFNQYKRKMESNYSVMERQNYNWIGHMLYGTLVIIGMDTLISIYEFLKGGFAFETGYIAVVGLVFLLGYLLIYGTAQTSIFLPDFLLTCDVRSSGYKESADISIPTEEAKIYGKRLNAIMKDKEPYLNEDLTLLQLANEVGLTDKKLSAFLNQNLDTSFYDYVNKFRTEEVKRKIADPKYSKYSLLGLAHLSGFKSKSSFYRSFKKHNKMLPTAYRNALKMGSSASSDTL